jgi:hypothetical protein
MTLAEPARNTPFLSRSCCPGVVGVWRFFSTGWGLFCYTIRFMSPILQDETRITKSKEWETMAELKLDGKYRAALSLRETELAIKMIKDYFQVNLSKALRLQRVSAPLFVRKGSGVIVHG